MATITAFNMGRLTGVHRRGSIEYRVLAGLLLQFTESTGFQRIPVEWAGDPDVRNREGYYHAAISLYDRGFYTSMLLLTNDGQSFLSDKIRIGQRGKHCQRVTLLCTESDCFATSTTIAKLWRYLSKKFDLSSCDALCSVQYRLMDWAVYADRLPNLYSPKHIPTAWKVVRHVLSSYSSLTHSLRRILNA